MNNLVTRSVSGLIYVCIIVGALLGGEIWTVALALLFAGLGAAEFSRLTGPLNARTAPGIALDVIGAMLVAVAPLSTAAVYSWCVLAVLRGVYEQYANLPDPMRRLGMSALTQVYVGVPMAFVTAAAYAGMERLLLGVFILIWINDTAAYLAGSAFGRHRLFERLSPKKSWEGFAGGFAGVLAACVAFALCCPDFFGLHGVAAWLSVGIVTTVFATWGDLMESLLKRSLGVKDSGHIIPGHGGILDRIDSALFAIPMVYIFVSILQGL